MTSDKGYTEQMQAYMKQFKKNIEMLIEQVLLKEAKQLVDEYEKIVPDDVDIYSIRGVIAMMEGDLDEAERVLKEGLDKQIFNFDLLYNIAYLFETRERYIESYRYYKKALKVCDIQQEESIQQKIKELEGIERVKGYTLRKKVLFCAHIFPPVGGSGVQRSLKFVKYLRNYGWEPIVVTVGRTMYPLKDESMLSEIPEEVEIIRIDENMQIDNNYVNELFNLYRGVIKNDSLFEEYIKELNKSQQLSNHMILVPDAYILWAKEVLDCIEECVDLREIDIIYTTSGPYSCHIIGYYLKMKYNIPWVADFRDEWTNNPYIDFDKDNIMYKINLEMEKNIVNFADKIINVTPLMSENYVKIFNLDSEKIVVITNGYDETDFAKIDTGFKNKNNKFTIMHNGIMYMIRTPQTFLQAIYNLINHNKINKNEIKIIFGLTDNKQDWINYVKQLQIDNVVEFYDYMTHEQSLKMASQSDCLLLIVGTGEKNKAVYPGKVFEYLRLCKPIIALSPKGSVVDTLINETKRGFNVEFNDIGAIEQVVFDLYKIWKNNCISNYSITESIYQFERNKLTKRLSDVLYEQTKNKRFSYSIDSKDNNFYNILYENGGWNQTYFKHYSETHYYESWKHALTIIKEKKDPVVLEIGCGTGQFANLLFDNGIYKYKGVDFSEVAIKYAKIRNDKYRHMFVVDDVYISGLFYTYEYNIVIAFEILEHVEKDLEIFEKIKPNCDVLFSVPNFYCEGHVRWFSSKLEIIERYKNYLYFRDIITFKLGGSNKLFLVNAKKR